MNNHRKTCYFIGGRAREALIMKNRLLLGLTLVLVILGGCAGTGERVNSTTISQLDQYKDTNRIFLFRENTGAAGAGMLLEVSVNGKNIGKLGPGEVIHSAGIAGDNVITTAVSSPLVPLIKGRLEHEIFEVKDRSNRFYLVQFSQMGWRLREVPEQVFRNLI